MIKELREQVKLLQADVEYLHNLLDEANISYATNASVEISNLEVSINEVNQGEQIISEKITPSHGNFFYSMFMGRSDIYSKQSK